MNSLNPPLDHRCVSARSLADKPEPCDSWRHAVDELSSRSTQKQHIQPAIPCACTLVYSTSLIIEWILCTLREQLSAHGHPGVWMRLQRCYSASRDFEKVVRERAQCTTANQDWPTKRGCYGIATTFQQLVVPAHAGFAKTATIYTVVSLLQSSSTSADDTYVDGFLACPTLDDPLHVLPFAQKLGSHRHARMR